MENEPNNENTSVTSPRLLSSILREDEIPRAWSRYYLRCIACGTQESKHAAFGLCSACYLAKKLGRRKLLEEYRKKNRMMLRKKWRERYGSLSSEARAEYERKRKRRWYIQNRERILQQQKGYQQKTAAKRRSKKATYKRSLAYRRDWLRKKREQLKHSSSQEENV